MADQDHPLYAALDYLESRNSSWDYWLCVDCLEKLLVAIKENPNEDRYRRFPVKEPEFEEAVGKLKGSQKCMIAAGFYIDSSSRKPYYVMDANHKSWSNLKQAIKILQKTLRDGPSQVNQNGNNPKQRSGSSSRAKSSDRKGLNEHFREESRKPPSRSGSGKSDRRSLSRSGSGKSKQKSRRKMQEENDYEEELRCRLAPSPFSMSSTDGDRTYFEDEPDNEMDIMQLYTDSTASSRSLLSPSDFESSFSSRGSSSPTGENHRHSKRSKSKKSKKKSSSSTSQALRDARMRTNVDDANDDERRNLIRSPPTISPSAKARSQRSLRSVASTMSAAAAMEGNSPRSKKSLLNVYKGGRDDEDEEESEHGPSAAQSRWLGASSKSVATGKHASSRRSLRKTESTRSMGSSAGSSRRGLFRQSSSRSSMKSERKLEREASLRTKKEKRLMKKEEKELRMQRKQLIQERIKLEGGPRWSFLMMMVTILTVAELGLDLGTTVISFVSLIESFQCCGQEVDAGALTLGITVPYFILIVIELIVLAFSVREARINSRRDQERMQGIDNLDEEWYIDDKLWDFAAEKRGCFCGRLLEYIVVANPFLGALITWALLYEVQSQTEAYIMVGLEGGSILLMFISAWLTRERMTFCKLMYHAIPLLPFSGICVVLWYYLQKGGICFRDGIFLFDMCGVCSDTGEPAVNDGANCVNGTVVQGTFCGDVVSEQFCYYTY